VPLWVGVKAFDDVAEVEAADGVAAFGAGEVGSARGAWRRFGLALTSRTPARMLALPGSCGRLLAARVVAR